MKKIIVFVLLFVAVNASAQNDADGVAKPVITAVGRADGIKKEIKINKGGGSLYSSDGMMELIIPEGAVAKKTTISIQPITNLMANGNGNAYRLEPSGIHFEKPVQLIFHYDEEAITDSMQLLLGIAMQDDKGQWYSLNKFNLDTVGKTISGNINHFSDWSYFSELKIDPDNARVKVKHSIYLNISGVKPSPKQTNNDDGLMSLEKKPKNAIWSVNKIVGGNSVVGKLSRSANGYLESGNVYIAPYSVPNQNPVAVSVKLEGLSYTTQVKGKSITFNNLRLVSNLLIYDNAYEVTIIGSVDGNAGSQFGTVTYKDTGSFVISVNGKDSKIIEKVNKNIPDKLDYVGRCIITQLKKGSGNIHIIGANSIKVIPPASAGANPWIEIGFKHAPSVFPVVQFKCPPVGKGDWTIDDNRKANALMAMMPAFPQRIKFEAKEGEQVIEEINQQGIFYKVTVKQLKED